MPAVRVRRRRPCLLVIAGPRLGEIIPIEGEMIIGREPNLTLPLVDDEAVSRRHARVVAEGERAYITDLGSVNGTYVDGQRIKELELASGAKIRIGQTTVLKFACYDEMEEIAQRELLEAALRDSMTRAFNRRYFARRLTAELFFSDRHQQTLTLLMIDVDRFKEINDRFGHLAGDAVLMRLVELLLAQLRAEDVLARYGGEEFTVLARSITPAAAAQLGERLRVAVESEKLWHADCAVRVTISVGIASFPFEGATLETAPHQLVELADRALYRAKSSGRNRVST